MAAAENSLGAPRSTQPSRGVLKVSPCSQQASPGHPPARLLPGASGRQLRAVLSSTLRFFSFSEGEVRPACWVSKPPPLRGSHRVVLCGRHRHKRQSARQAAPPCAANATPRHPQSTGAIASLSSLAVVNHSSPSPQVPVMHDRARSSLTATHAREDKKGRNPEARAAGGQFFSGLCRNHATIFGRANHHLNMSPKL